MKSIPGLHKRLKIRAQFTHTGSVHYRHNTDPCFRLCEGLECGSLRGSDSLRKRRLKSLRLSLFKPLGNWKFPWRYLENNALSSLHKFLRNRQVIVCGGELLQQPPLAGSVTIYAKTTVDCSPDSSMEIPLRLQTQSIPNRKCVSV